jgi:hypothetical protein
MKSTGSTHWFISFICTLVVWMLFAVTPGHSLAGTYYVDQNHPRASDVNPGTESLPWKTLYRAAEPQGKQIVAGDTVLVKAGTYDVSTGGAWYRPAINPANSGQPGKPITFKAYPGHTVILDAKNVMGNPAIGSLGRDYIVIDGFTVINGGDKGMVVTSSSAQRVKGVVIQNNDISGIWRPDFDNTDGIRIENTSGTVVRNNRIHNVHNGVGTPNGAGIKMYRNDHAIIENNEIFDVGAGIFDKAFGEFNIFRRNLIHHCTHEGIRFHSSARFGITHDGAAYENIVYGCKFGAAVDPIDVGTVKDISIYNNTFATYSDSGFYLTTPNVSYPANVRLWNNIFHRTGDSTRGDRFTYDNPPVAIGLANYNLFSMAPKIIVGVYQPNQTAYTSLAALQGALGWDTKSVVANPLFVSAGNHDYHLAPDSPALGAGRVGGVSSGAVVNIGAYTTGNEVIGIKVGGSPPLPPTGLTLR